MSDIQNTLLDNSKEPLFMTTALKKCLKKSGLTDVCIATGYWDLGGMSLIAYELQDFLLRDNSHLRLLIGKDPFVYCGQIKEPKYKDASYPEDFIKTDINELTLNEDLEPTLQLLLNGLQHGKIEIRIFQRNSEDEYQFLHAKCYIFLGDNDGVKWKYGIIGSSNFTAKGLQGNSELNHLETNKQIVGFQDVEDPSCKGHLGWFEEKWALADDWTKEFYEQVLKQAPITKQLQEKQEKITKANDPKLTPYELYIKVLQQEFGQIVDNEPEADIRDYLPPKYQLLSYQMDAVKQCFSTMQKHNGFILADVVGLGKTVIGVLLIKHFINTETEPNRSKNVLIITPPAIKPAWEKTIQEIISPDSSDKITIRTTGKVSSMSLYDDLELNFDEEDEDTPLEMVQLKQNYGLIIIDESHKFRNKQTVMYKSLDTLIGQIRGRTGCCPYVGLVSATPQNNRPRDIQNQIYLFERSRKNSTLKKADGGDLESFFNRINKEYDQLLKPKENIADSQAFDESISPEERQKKLINLAGELRQRILDDLMIRRTRTDVVKYYSEDMTKQGLVFPKIEGPISLKYEMESELANLFIDTVNIIAPTDELQKQTKRLNYARYRAIQYFKNESIKEKYRYKNLSAERFSDQLAKIMEMSLVKRLESSFAAFKKSLNNLLSYTDNMISMWDNNRIFVCPDIDVNCVIKEHGYNIEDSSNALAEKIENLNKSGKNEKQRNCEYHQDDFSSDYIKLLKQDIVILKEINKRWSSYDVDPKREVFISKLPEILDSSRNQNHKLVIFTEAIDTVDSLYRAINGRTFGNNQPCSVLKITAENRQKMESVIKENFDANYDGISKDDYNIILTTEVLAEGINLHRANSIVNYDTPWNSTRLMQRIGRVNRIGSTAEKVYVYNFLPSTQGDAEINLVNKAHAKLQSFHTMFGEDNKVYSDQEEVIHYDLTNTGDYNAMFNGDESANQKYIQELRRYKSENPERYEAICQQETNLRVCVDAPCCIQPIFLVTNGMTQQYIELHNKKPLDQFSILEKCNVLGSLKQLPLGDNLKVIERKALKIFHKYLESLKLSGHQEQMDEARNIISDFQKKYVKDNDELSEILRSARSAVDDGDIDITNVLLILKNKESQLNNGQLISFRDELVGQLNSLIHKDKNELTESVYLAFHCIGEQ